MYKFLHWKLAAGALFASLALLGQIAADSKAVALSGLDSKSTLVPAGSAATLLNFVADPSSAGGDQLDIVLTDPGVVISLVLPSGTEITGANAAASGFQYSAFARLSEPGKLAGSIFERGGYHILIDFPSGQAAGTYSIKANASSVAVDSGLLATYLSSSNVRTGVRAGASTYRVGDTATLWGVVLEDSSGVVGVSMQAAVLRNTSVTSGVSITNLVLSGQTAIDANTVEYAYRADLVNTGSALTNVSATASTSLTGAVVTITDLVFGDVAASSTTTSGNSFKIQLPASQTFSPGMLNWSYQAQDLGTTVTLTDGGSVDGTAGDGLYGGTMVLTAPGNYVVGLRSTGVSNSGVPFSRFALCTFTVTVPIANFVANSFTDSPVGTPIQQINVAAVAAVQTAGTYRFSGELMGANGQVAVAETTATLSAGSQNLSLSFPAAQLLALGNGPYARQWLRLRLVDPSGGVTLADQQINAGSTAAYTLSSLDHGAVYFTNQNSAAGVDLTGSGKFDVLRVQLGVVTAGGDCNWSGSLTTLAGTSISFASGSATVPVGSASITLDFNGNLMAQNGLDGPYIVTRAGVSCNSGFARMGQTWQTPAFTASQFHLVQQSISLSLDRNPVTVTAGLSDVIVSSASSGGLSGNATVSFLGLPSGVTLGFDPSMGNQISANGFLPVSLSVNSSVLTGSYPFSVNATNGTVSTTLNATLAVTGADFGIATSPASLTASSTGQAAMTVTVTPSNGFSGSVTLNAAGLPGGVVAGFAPQTVTGSTPGSSTLTLTTTSATPGSYPYTITGVSGSLTHSASATLVVSKLSPAITWSNPSDITVGTALGAAQLNASSSVAGTFVYSPAAGAILQTGDGQLLRVDFTPTDLSTYNLVSKTVVINVKASGGTSTECGNGYQYCRSITMDHTKVGASDSSNFPLLISGTYSWMATAANGGRVTNTVAQSGGGAAITVPADLVFTSDAACSTPLSWEFESYTAATGTAMIWVRVPALSHTNDTVIWACAGKAAAVTWQGNASGAWDSNFKAVYHLPNGTTLSANDSTTNANNGTVVGSVTAAAGEIGGGANVVASGRNDIEIPDAPSLRIAQKVTLSAWVNQASRSANGGLIVQKRSVSNSAGGFNYSLWADPNGKLFFQFHDSADRGFTGSASVPLNAWTHVAVTVDETSATPLTFYMNGSADSSPAYAGAMPASGTDPLQIGNYGPYSGGVFQFNGTIDEVRVSSTARSADWIRAEYNNQGSPSTFYAVGTEQIPSPGFTLSASAPAPATVVPGGTATSTVTVTPTGGFSSAVTLSTVSWPSGITGAFSPSAPTSTSTLTISVASSVTAGSYSLPISGTATGVNSQSATLTLQVQAAGGGGACGNGYQYCRMITVDHTKVGASDSVNFPVLISGTYSWMATTANGGRVTNTIAQSGGAAITVPADMVFTSDAACSVPLSWEFESYTSTNGAASLWVRVPTVSHTTDTAIWACVGNAAAVTWQGSVTGAWDSSFKGVYHLSNASPNDSSANTNNGAVVGTVASAAGEIAGGANFVTTGRNDIEIPDSASLRMSQKVTLSAWVNQSSRNSYGGLIVQKRNVSNPAVGFNYSLWSDGGNGTLFFQFNDGAYRGFNGNTTLPLNTWTQVAVTIDETSATPITFYVNGVPDGSPTYAGTMPASGTEPLQMGNYGQLSGGIFPFDGTIDEVHISSVARSADWLRTEYNNQSSPSTFYAVGAEQSSGPGFTLSAAAASPATVTAGSTASSIVTIAPVNGFSSAVSLATVNWPSGITGTFSPNPATSTSTLTISVASTVAAGSYSLSISGAATGVNSQSATLTLQVQAAGAGGACGNGYQYCRTVTMDHTKVGGSDSSNFPVLISGTYSWMATTASGGRVNNTVTQSGGGTAITVPADLIFTSDSSCSTPLSWEFESYAPTSGAASLWVRVPALSHTVDTGIWACVGKAAAVTWQGNVTGAWDSNFKSVYHLSNASTNDSSANANNGAVVGTVTAATGEIAGGANFVTTGRNDIEIPDAPSLRVAQKVTLSAWVNQASRSANGGLIVQKRNVSNPAVGFNYGLWADPNGKLFFQFNDGAYRGYTGSASVALNAWTHVAVTVDETSATPLTFYMNGSADSSPAYAGAMPASGTDPLQIGNYGPYSGGVFQFNGTIDEVRVSSTARSADWIRAEYNNQGSPSTFYAVGTEQVSGPGFTLSASTPAPATVVAGGTATSTVTITPSGGFSSAVTLSTVNWPTGVTGAFSPSAVTSTSTLTISVASTVTAGSYSLPISGTATGVNSQSATLTLQVQAAGGGACGNGYQYCRTITVDHTKVGASDPSNFPVLISGTYSWMATTASGGRVNNTVAQSGGGTAITVPADLIFTSDAACTTPLSWEFESYTATSGAASLWVRVPALSHTTDTAIWACVGKAAAVTWQGNVTGAWDNSFKGVYHLSNASPNDSSANANNGAVVGTVASAAGEVAGGANFVTGGRNDIEIPDSASLRMSQKVTLSAWINQSSRNSYGGLIVQKRNVSNPAAGFNYSLWSDGGTGTLFFQFNDGAYRGFDANTPLPLSTWTYVAVTVDETSATPITFYVNGVADGSPAYAGSMPASGTEPLQMGNYGQLSGGIFQFNGTIDEVHISSVARSADWLRTEYNNQGSPSTFYAVGAEEAAH